MDSPCKDNYIGKDTAVDKDTIGKNTAGKGGQKRVLIYATTAYMIERFNMMNIRLLQDLGYTVDVACNFETGNPMSRESLESFKAELKALNVETIQLPLNRRIYDVIGNGRALFSSVKLMRDRHYSFVHCHTPVGAAVARLAAWLTGTRIIYTAHGFHFFDGAPRVNWLLYYPVEKLLSHLTDVLITINSEDYERARAKFAMKHLEYVPGIGIDTERFTVDVLSRKEMRAELGIAPGTKILLSVGELSRRKNHISVLRALATSKELSGCCYVIAGTGVYRDALQQYIDEQHVEDRVRLIGYREDTRRLYCAADVFVFPSYQEGLSAALMEAMTCGLPVVASRIRGNTDLIDDEGGVLFEVGREPRHIEDESISVPYIREALESIFKLPEETLAAMGEHNRDKIREGFGTDAVRHRLKEIYTSLS